MELFCQFKGPELLLSLVLQTGLVSKIFVLPDFQGIHLKRHDSLDIHDIIRLENFDINGCM